MNREKSRMILVKFTSVAAAMLHVTADRFTKQEFFKIKEGQRIFLARPGNSFCFVIHFADAVIVNDDGLPKMGMAVFAKLAEVGNFNFSELFTAR